MKKAGTPTQKGMTIADMAKQKSQAGLYGANAQPMAFQQPRTAGQKPSTGSSGLDDLLG
jgi:epsin